MTKLILLIIFVLVSFQSLSSTTTEDFYLGSYNSVIKISNELSSDEDWNLTISTLQDSNHNLYGYKADDGVSNDDNTGFYWQNFLELLEETKDTDIKIFAVVRESHLVGTTTNRWGVNDGNSSEEWYDAHLQAATELSKLSSSYPHFIGWNIDDFGGKICNPGHIIKGKDCYTKEQVETISSTSKIYDGSFEFWPTNYFREFYTYMDSYALGSTYGVKMYPGEYAKLELFFNLDSTPSEANLSFLYHDTNKDDDEDAVSYSNKFKHNFSINDYLIWDKDIAGDSYVEDYKTDISSYLTSGENVITFTFYTNRTSKSNGYHEKMIYISKPELIIDGSEISYSESFTTSINSTTYTNLNNESTSNDGSSDGIIKIVSTTTTDSNIAELVDGVLTPYYSESTFYTEGRFNNLLELINDQFPTGFKNLLVLYGMLWDKNIDPNDLEQQIILASNIVDGVIIWNNPLVTNHSLKGVLSQKENSGNDTVFYWPGYRPGLQGFYQEWDTINQYSEYNISIYDTDDSNTKDYFFKEIYLEDGTLIYNDSVNGSEGIEWMNFSLSSPQKLKIKIYENLGVGNYVMKILFTVNADDNVLTNENFIFDSNTNSVEITNIYSSITSAFTSILSETMISFSIIDGDINDDGVLDSNDAIEFILELSSNFNSVPSNVAADMNSDNILDWLDVKLFAQEYFY